MPWKRNSLNMFRKGEMILDTFFRATSDTFWEERFDKHGIKINSVPYIFCECTRCGSPPKKRQVGNIRGCKSRPGTKACGCISRDKMKERAARERLRATPVEYTSKVCNKCGIEKPLEDFPSRKESRDGKRSDCKACYSQAKSDRYEENKDECLQKCKDYYQKNKELVKSRVADYVDRNREKVNARHREYHVKNRVECNLRSQQYKEDHQEERKEYSRRYAEKNRDEIKKKKRIASKQPQYRKKRNEQQAERYRNDKAYKLTVLLRTRMNSALKGKSKTGSAVRNMGCTGQEACDCLESLFDEQMTWDNWGSYWEVDHIYPIAAANLQDRVEFIAVNNWQNLQPLEAISNLKKGDKVTPKAQKLFNKLKKEFSKENAA